MLDGKLLGYVDPKIAVSFVTKLRRLKIAQLPEYSWLPRGLEVAFLPSEEITVQMRGQKYDESKKIKQKFFPGVFLATTASRFIRPV